ncbi:1560_t:CDS:1, partial [Gigaspora rosea]
SKSDFSLSFASEAVLQVITELVLQNNQIPKMCLVIDSDKKKGDGRYGFIDLIFGDFSFGDLNLSIMIELKYINLSGLIKAMNNDWNDTLTQMI